MVSYSSNSRIEPSARLHDQDAAMSSRVQGALSSNLVLHVDGWYQQQQHQQPTAHLHTEASTNERPLVFDRIASHSTIHSAGAKRSAGPADGSDSLDRSSKRTRDDNDSTFHHGGVRINDLLNPAAAAVAATAATAPLAAAKKLSVPSALTRTRSADTKQYLNLLQLQLQKQTTEADPRRSFARTFSAPEKAESPKSDSAQGLVREALELDKLYDIACVIIESIWPNHSVSQRTQLCSLRCFVAETHRQSRLGVDALELCMFYLLRAKSIIQARQRAARQKEEAEEEQRKQQIEQIEKQSQMSFQSILEATQNTPPLSPSSPMSLSRASTNNVIVTKSSSAHNANSILSPPSSSPITPNSTQQAIAQAPFVTMDKQLLDNGIISPTQAMPEKRQQQQQSRVLAGNTKALPMSFREFMSKDTPLMAVSCNNTMASPAASPKEAGSTPKPKKPDVTKCGRRMFVAALVSASKFMYDRTYSNRAWNKITKLPLAQISDMERAFLSMIDYRLYVDQRTYDKFHRLLARSGMRNGRLMVCEPASAGDAAGPHLQSQQQQQQQTQPQSQSQQQTQMSPATADFTFAAPSATPSPEQQRAKVQKMMIQYSMSASPNTPVTGDLRSAMNVPLSVASTPAGMHSAVSMPMMGGSDPRAMQVQEQLLNFLRAKQAQQQQQQRIILQHQQQVMHHHHVSQQRVPAAGEVSFE